MMLSNIPSELAVCVRQMHFGIDSPKTTKTTKWVGRQRSKNGHNAARISYKQPSLWCLYILCLDIAFPEVERARKKRHAAMKFSFFHFLMGFQTSILQSWVAQRF